MDVHRQIDDSDQRESCLGSQAGLMAKTQTTSFARLAPPVTIAIGGMNRGRGEDFCFLLGISMTRSKWLSG
jgi:hypothetical protein